MSGKMGERLCVNCKHSYEQYHAGNDYVPRSYSHHCYALKGKTNPVFGGDIDTIDIFLMRATLCGWSWPAMWEPKTTPPE